MSVIDEVKSRIDIVDLVGETVQLQKAGRNFRARCPFHTERTPSFHVRPDHQTWHCFGACATGGDVISFVMRRDNIEFPEALRLLAHEVRDVEAALYFIHDAHLVRPLQRGGGPAVTPGGPLPGPSGR